MARALSGTVAADRLTVVVNVGDDDSIYGVHVAADLDTVLYTLAGIEGPHGWGLAGDTFHVMEEMAARGVDTSFRLGDRDLAQCLLRTVALHSGSTLSEITADLARSLQVAGRVVPATDEPLRTRVQLRDGTWLTFQEYFVLRQHRDEVTALDYRGADASQPAPGVLEAIRAADVIVIAPSNPPLSIWPILAIPGVRAALAAAPIVAAVSPLFGGKALKGPADRVMASLGLPRGTAGVLSAYDGLLTALVVDEADRGDERLSTEDVTVIATDTRIADPEAGRRFAAWLIDTMLQ
jgi:LPPG:FO 2-phospho-L-lactate transferase